MLIVAMPKSASSSLARTIARAHGLDERNDDINAGFPPQFADAHQLAQELHPYPAIPMTELRHIVIDRAALRKLHLFPTQEVLDAIGQERVIVLLRNPSDVVDAEYRALINGIHPLAPSMPRTASLRRWRRAAVAGGLLTSLEQFRDGWIAAARDRPEMRLVTYEAVIHDSVRTLDDCARHLGLSPVTMDLLQERWTGGKTVGDGPLGSYTYLIASTLRRVRLAAARRLHRPSWVRANRDRPRRSVGDY